MDILEIAIKAEGGVSKLAVVLGEKQNVVSNWRGRRLPRAWAKFLQLKYADRLELSQGQPPGPQPTPDAAATPARLANK